jgi:neutral ceramidase
MTSNLLKFFGNSRWTHAACIVAMLAGCEAPRHGKMNAVQVGAAELDITPPVGHRMAGYFDERVSTGVHDPLLAKAVVLRQGDTRLAFVFCDLVGIPLEVSSRARIEASVTTGIPLPNIVVSATHTHTGPLFGDVRRDYFHQRAVATFGNDPKEKVFYPDLLQKAIVTSIIEANANLRPAVLLSGQGMLNGYSFNRRYHMTNGIVQTNPGLRNPGIVRPAGPVDHSVGILQALPQTGGAPHLTITTFACHCDTCGGTLYSGDFPFYLSESLRKQYGNSHLSAFAAGTCGDINHIDVTETNRITGYAKSEQIGTNLALAVMETRLTPVRRPSFAARSRTIVLPLQDVSSEQVANANAQMAGVETPTMPFLTKVETVKIADLAARGKQWPMEVQVFRLDKDTAIVCLPGEIFVELGLEIKRQSPFPNTTIMTICNDRPAYVPTLKAFREGSYEVVNSRVKPGGGEVLVSTAVKLLHELK